MKKYFLFGLVLILCGCGVVEEGITDIKSTKYGLAKNSVSSYASSVMAAYTEYRYVSAVGEYVSEEGSTPVDIDGTVVDLNVKYYGDNIECSSVSVVKGAVRLDGCLIYDYEFKYDGEAIQK